MWGNQLARQWRILRTIESRKQGATVAGLAEQESCSPRTIWRDLAAIQAAGSPLYSDVTEHETRNRSNDGRSRGLCEVMTWVMAWRPLQDFQFWHRSRKRRILPA